MQSSDSLENREATSAPPAKALDRAGFIAGPEENLADLRARSQHMNAFQARIERSFQEEGTFDLVEHTFSPEERIPVERMKKAARRAAEAYQFDIDWVPGFYSDRNLFCLYGGMAVGLEDNEGEIAKGALFSFFQLRKAFAAKGRFLIYTEEELISHEICHIARMQLRSTKYEEVFAYRISSSALRRYAGPIFRAQSDMFGMLAGLGVFLATQFVVLLQLTASPMVWLGRMPLILFLLYALIRNRATHKNFTQACDNLTALFGEEALPAAFRLTDKEIDALGAGPMDSGATRDYLSSALSPLRWEILQTFLSSDHQEEPDA